MEKTINPIKPDVSLDDILKLDIRIGQVKKASLIEGTELINQEVDFGPEIGTRTILSKIAKHVTPEYMEGKSFPYILNLPPRKMRGIMSEGMIVAVGDINTDETIMFENKAASGSEVWR